MTYEINPLPHKPNPHHPAPIFVEFDPMIGQIYLEPYLPALADSADHRDQLVIVFTLDAPCEQALRQYIEGEAQPLLARIADDFDVCFDPDIGRNRGYLGADGQHAKAELAEALAAIPTEASDAYIIKRFHPHYAGYVEISGIGDGRFRIVEGPHIGSRKLSELMGQFVDHATRFGRILMRLGPDNGDRILDLPQLVSSKRK